MEYLYAVLPKCTGQKEPYSWKDFCELSEVVTEEVGSLGAKKETPERPFFLGSWKKTKTAYLIPQSEESSREA